MQPLSTTKSDLVFLPHLFHFERDHHTEGLSVNLNNSLPFIPSRQGRGRGLLDSYLPFVFVKKKYKASGMKFA
jgi:hypothetical protein